MKQTNYAPYFLLLALVGISACQSSTNNSQADAIATLANKVDAMDKKLDSIASRLQAPKARQAPKRPTVGQLYKLPVSADDAFRGGTDAKVTVAIASEFACPYCQQLDRVTDNLLDVFEPEELKVVSKHYIVHPSRATKPALASCAAHLQGKFAGFQSALWQSAWPGENPKFAPEGLADASLEHIAEDQGLDMARYRQDIAKACPAIVARNQRELASIGVRGTPAIYVNGRYYGGPRTKEALTAAIEAEVKKADLALKNGAKLSEYYRDTIAGGKTSI